MLWLISFLTICLLIYKYFQIKYSYWKDLKIPYLKPFMPFGNFKDVVLLKMCPGEFLQQVYNKTQEKLIGIWLLWMPCLIIRDPSLINAVLVKDFNNFCYHAVLAEEKCDSICSKMLFFLRNSQWKLLRAKTTPYFTSSKLKEMTPLIQGVTDDLRNYILHRRGKSLEMKEICVKFSTDAVMSCFYGLKGNSFEEDGLFYSFSQQSFGLNYINAMRFILYFFLPDIGRLFNISFVDPKITKFLRKLIWQVIHDREISNEKRNDIIDCLIKMRKSNVDVFGDGSGFEGDQVVSIPVQMFIAGIDTTGSVLAYTLFEIGLSQEIQEKLREEITSTVNNREDLTFEILNQMTYLDKVVSEALRKYPILSFLDRQAVDDYQISNSDYVIKKGTTIYVPILGIHYDPEYYPEPQVFDPERFSKENVEKRRDNVYIPFGGGPRHCIGNRFAIISIKLAMVNILREFRIVKCDKSAPVVFEGHSGLLIAKDGLWMRFESIKN